VREWVCVGGQPPSVQKRNHVHLIATNSVQQVESPQLVAGAVNFFLSEKIVVFSNGPETTSHITPLLPPTAIPSFSFYCGLMTFCVKKTDFFFVGITSQMHVR
jgi:hypothetical protein